MMYKAPNRERNNKIRSLALTGMSRLKISKEIGCDYKTVSKVLNDNQWVELVNDQNEAIKDLVPKAVEVYSDTLKLTSKQADTKLKAARDILNSAGALKDNKNVNLTEKTIVKIEDSKGRLDSFAVNRAFRDN